MIIISCSHTDRGAGPARGLAVSNRQERIRRAGGQEKMSEMRREEILRRSEREEETVSELQGTACHLRTYIQYIYTH